MMDLSHVQFHGKPVRAPFDPLSLHASGSVAGVCVDRAAAAPITGLAALVLERAGLDTVHYRRGPLERRVPACLRALKAGSELDAHIRLGREPHLHNVAINALLIGVSSFFRDAPVFDAIRANAVPALRQGHGPIRVLSVGCSNGAELYSMAILLAQAGLLDRCELLGTDCRSGAVLDARAGTFNADAMSAVDEDTRACFFERVGRNWRIVPELRRVASWQVADATAGTPDGAWDVILCRNVAIYLQPASTARLFRDLTRRLAPGGLLVLGRAERPSTALGLSGAGPCLYRKHVES